jgi:hypothetical protein
MVVGHLHFSQPGEGILALPSQTKPLFSPSIQWLSFLGSVVHLIRQPAI